MKFRKIVSWGTVAIVGRGGGQRGVCAKTCRFPAAGKALIAWGALPASVLSHGVEPI